MRVLLVEDHPVVRFAISTLLQLQEDMDLVGEADNAHEALRLVRRLRPDLVILDLNLPGEPGGVETCQEMKALPDPPRVLVYTAYNSREEIHSCFLSGADSYVHKGEDHTRLTEAIRETHAGKKTWLMGDKVEEARPRLGDVSKNESLTPREHEVFGFLVRQYPNDRIAEELYVSLPTVKTHVRRILKKLKIKNRKALL